MTKNIRESVETAQIANVSRRQLLQGATLAAGSAAILGATITSAQAKMTQAAAGYQDKPKDGNSCSTCALFKAPNGCTLVDGTISPDGWCRFYAKKS